MTDENPATDQEIEDFEKANPTTPEERKAFEKRIPAIIDGAMKKIENDPALWSEEAREAYLIEKIEWGNTFYYYRPKFERNAHCCQMIRAKLVEMGFNWSLDNAGMKFIFCIYIKQKKKCEATEDSENRAVIIAACRALIARGKE